MDISQNFRGRITLHPFPTTPPSFCWDISSLIIQSFSDSRNYISRETNGIIMCMVVHQFYHSPAINIFWHWTGFPHHSRQLSPFTESSFTQLLVCYFCGFMSLLPCHSTKAGGNGWSSSSWGTWSEFRVSRFICSWFPLVWKERKDQTEYPSKPA